MFGCCDTPGSAGDDRRLLTALETIPHGGHALSLQALQRVFGDELADWTPPANAKRMDYSGAVLSAVGLQWREGCGGDKPATVLVKFVDPIEALATANEAKRVRTMRSYDNEAAVLRDLCAPLAAAGTSMRGGGGTATEAISLGGGSDSSVPPPR